EERGFQVAREGRLPLSARAVYSGPQRAKPEPLPGGAPFVTYSREAGPLGLPTPATWIRIPWTPRLVDRSFLIDLRMRLTGLRRPKQATWLENFLWGERHLVTLSFNDVRTRATFPMYLAYRDRVVHLSEDPSTLTITFADSDHLKIHEVFPGSSQRRTSESRRGTEIVSTYIDPSEGLRPQVLTVQYGYFSGWQSWAPVLFATLFFVLGNVAGPLVATLAKRLGARLQGRIRFGPRSGAGAEQHVGTIVPRETLTRIAPGAPRLARGVGPGRGAHPRGGPDLPRVAAEPRVHDRPALRPRERDAGAARGHGRRPVESRDSAGEERGRHRAGPLPPLARPGRRRADGRGT